MNAPTPWSLEGLLQAYCIRLYFSKSPFDLPLIFQSQEKLRQALVAGSPGESAAPLEGQLTAWLCRPGCRDICAAFAYAYLDVSGEPGDLEHSIGLDRAIATASRQFKCRGHLNSQ